MCLTKELKYTLVRSARKTLAIQISKNAEIIVRAPKNMPLYKIEEFLFEKRDWILKNVEKMKSKAEAPVRRLSKDEIDALFSKAMEVIPKRVAYYAPKVGVRYNRITIRNQKTRWGSCSSKGNLNFNCLLMLTPIEVIDSVVVHELCHIKELNHSKRFYEEVYRVYPEYDCYNGWLKEHGPEIMRKMWN